MEDSHNALPTSPSSSSPWQGHMMGILEQLGFLDQVLSFSNIHFHSPMLFHGLMAHFIVWIYSCLLVYSLHHRHLRQCQVLADANEPAVELHMKDFV